jgi:hypothetical protein
MIFVVPLELDEVLLLEDVELDDAPLEDVEPVLDVLEDELDASPPAPLEAAVVVVDELPPLSVTRMHGP